MNFANPHYFSAILDGISHRFILVMESESMKGHTGYSPPRFTVGGMNGTRDPRMATLKQLMEVGVKKSALHIPASKRLTSVLSFFNLSAFPCISLQTG
jgi:hypothetical protein